MDLQRSHVRDSMRRQTKDNCGDGRNREQQALHEMMF
jgi:hypothetical protein